MSEEKNKKSDDVINIHLGFAMVAGAIPIPVVDIAAVTAIQMDMLKKLSDIYEIDFKSEIGKSLVSTIAASTLGVFLGQMGASAVKSIPGIGTILGIGSQVILAGATTYAIGKLFQYHFENGGTFADFNFETMKSKFMDFFKIGKGIAEKKQKSQSKEDIINTIAKMKELKDSGAITEEEFEKTKKELLDKITK